MAKLAKRTETAHEAFAGKELISIEDAVKLIKSAASAVRRTLEIAMNLGVDPRHADQMVRGVVQLPNGTGKTVRVAVFARGAKADEAKAAEVQDIVGAEDLMETIQSGRSSSIAASRAPGHDAARRPSRQNPRPAQPDAEPEGRHGDDGRENGCRSCQGR